MSYILDGGTTEVVFSTNGNNTGNFSRPRVVSQTGLNGSTIKIIIKMLNTADNESFYFDNILVQGTVSCGVTTFTGGTATQSSDYSASQGLASNAIDGNTSGLWSDNTVTHTTTQSNPWWELDMGANNTIDNVVIYNRTDCCSTRLDNFILEVLDASNNVVYTHTNGAAANTNTVSGINTFGRKIRIRLAG